MDGKVCYDYLSDYFAGWLMIQIKSMRLAGVQEVMYKFICERLRELPTFIDVRYSCPILLSGVQY